MKYLLIVIILNTWGVPTETKQVAQFYTKKECEFNRDRLMKGSMQSMYICSEDKPK